MKKLLFTALILVLSVSVSLAYSGAPNTNPQRAHDHLDIGNVKAAIHDWGCNGNAPEGGTGFQYPKIGGIDHGYSGTLMVGVPLADGQADVADSYGDDEVAWATSEGGALQFTEPGETGNQETWAMYEYDLTTASGPSTVTVTEKAYAWGHFDYDDFIIIEYTIENTGDYGLEDVYAGYFWDFDIGDDYSINMFGSDEALNACYVWENGQPMYVGTAILNMDANGAAHVDNPNDIYNTTSAQQDSIMYAKMSAGGFGADFGPTDISSMISVGPFNIGAGESIELVLAFVGGADYDAFAANVAAAQWAYDNDYDVPPPLPAPTDLTADVVDNIDVSLGWAAPPAAELDVIGYNIFRQRATDPEFTLLMTIDDPTTLTYLDEDVTIEGGQVGYYMTAVYEGDISGLPSDVITTELEDFTPAPLDLVIDMVDGQNVYLNWEEPNPSVQIADLQRYKLYRRQGETTNYSLVPGPPITDTEVMNTVTQDGIYFYYVMAVYSFDGVEYESEASNSAVASVGETGNILFEAFDQAVPPMGWDSIVTNASHTWIRANWGTHPFSDIDPTNVSSAFCAWDNTAVPKDEWLITPTIDLAAREDVGNVTFWAGYDQWVANVNMVLNITDDDGATWTQLWDAASDTATTWMWRHIEVSLDDFYGSTVKLGWQLVGADGNHVGLDNVQILAGYSGIADETVAAPVKFELDQNYPNPFNPVTSISFSVPTKGHVELGIYNASGQLVKTLVNEEKEASHYSVKWNGTDSTGASVNSGVYFYKIKADGFTETKRMILLK